MTMTMGYNLGCFYLVIGERCAVLCNNAMPCPCPCPCPGPGPGPGLSMISQLFLPDFHAPASSRRPWKPRSHVYYVKCSLWMTTVE